MAASIYHIISMEEEKVKKKLFNLCTHSLLHVETRAFTRDVGDTFKL